MITDTGKRGLRYLLLLAIVVALSGCVLPYYFQAARGQVSLLRQREPIAELVAAASLDADTLQRLEQVIAIRQFAIDELRLPASDSYTTFVDLERDFVVWNVVAAPEFSVNPETWCFPVAGCVAYRGYFDQARANSFADKLRNQGFDVFVGGARAYSTLGHFADPVLNTMLSLDTTRLAALLFHEMAHQRVYVKGNTGLSESFATAVEQFGVRQWLHARGDTDAIDRYQAQLQRQSQFAALISEQRERMSAVYARNLPPDAMREAKRDGFDQMQQAYEELRDTWGGVRDYDGWFNGGFNNARLAALSSYQVWVPGLLWRLEQLGPEQFYREVEALSELDDPALTARLEGWNRESAAGSLADF